MYRAVEHIVADADAQAADELGVDGVGNGEVWAVGFGETIDHALARGIIERDGAFNSDATAIGFKAREALECDQHRAVVAWFRLDESRDHGAQFRFVESSGGLAEPEQAACGGGGDFGNFHKKRRKRV